MCLCVCIVCIGGSIVRFSFLLEIYSLQFHNSFDSCLNFDHFLCYVLHNYSQNSKKKKKKYDLIFKPVITKNNIFDNLLIFVFSHSKDGKV